ncbi:MAG: NADH-quinone oxidoreductase subunit NuoE [Alphaproteobacteria bacterium]
MSVRRLDPNQSTAFEFTPDNLAWCKAQIAKYPEGREQSAAIPILWRAQEQNDGWLPEAALRAVGDLLGMAYIRVYEVATFYTMFNLSPVGKYFIQLCGTTPCMLRGSEELVAVLKEFIGPANTVTEDGLFSWTEVECMGACVNAPMVQINQDYYEDLTPGGLQTMLERLKNGVVLKPGSQSNRQFSAPASGPRTLLNTEE